MKRPKWNEMQPPLKVAHIVWLLKDITPRGIWPIVRLVEEHPGGDGTTRVVTVRTAYGTFNRPATVLLRFFEFFCNAFCNGYRKMACTCWSSMLMAVKAFLEDSFFENRTQ